MDKTQVVELSRAVVADMFPTELELFDVKALAVLARLEAGAPPAQRLMQTRAQKGDAELGPSEMLEALKLVGDGLKYVSILWGTYKFLNDVKTHVEARRNSPEKSLEAMAWKVRLIEAGVPEKVAEDIVVRHGRSLPVLIRTTQR